MPDIHALKLLHALKKAPAHRRSRASKHYSGVIDEPLPLEGPIAFLP
jgi:hypothetical protein